MGASLALAGLTACTRQPTEHIMPYVRQPEELIPGPAAVFRHRHDAERRRQRRAGGEPRRPAHQDRRQSRSIRPRSARAIPIRRPRCCSCTIPTARRRSAFTGRDSLLGRLLRRTARRCSPAEGQERRGHPHSHRDRHLAHHGGPAPRHSEAVSRAPSGISGSRPGRTARAPPPCRPSAQPVNTYYNLANANVVVSLDSDFLASGPASLRYARQFAARRRVRRRHAEMNRLYVVEPMPTPTGTKADHRLPLRAGDIEEFAWALATGLGVRQRPEDGREPRYLQVARPDRARSADATRAPAW